MSEKVGYEPNSDEIKEAESMMTDEQRKSTEDREHSVNLIEAAESEKEIIEATQNSFAEYVKTGDLELAKLCLSRAVSLDLEIAKDIDFIIQAEESMDEGEKDMSRAREHVYRILEKVTTEEEANYAASKAFQYFKKTGDESPLRHCLLLSQKNHYLGVVEAISSILTAEEYLDDTTFKNEDGTLVNPQLPGGKTLERELSDERLATYEEAHRLGVERQKEADKKAIADSHRLINSGSGNYPSNPPIFPFFW